MGSKRMKIKKILLYIIILLLSSSLHANPIALRFINELVVDTTGWIIELNDVWLCETLDSCYLTSISDTVYFKEGINRNYDRYRIITEDSLQKPFYINLSGDIIAVHWFCETIEDALSFGNVNTAEIVAPTKGQSISLWEDIYYLDNTPTLGNENDFLNTSCQIEGHITDLENNPLANVGFYHSVNWYETYSISDSLGNFTIHELAAKMYFYFIKDGYKSLSQCIQGYPDSTLTIHFQMSPLEDVVEHAHDRIHNYQLYDNYPNPFNSMTFFKYKIPTDNWVDINIYDIRGRLVENLYHGFQHAGEYTLMWNAVAVPSGTYIFQLKSSRVTLKKKCTLVK
jgi:hypothetical protein